jgi:hypothetical protein
MSGNAYCPLYSRAGLPFRGSAKLDAMGLYRGKCSVEFLGDLAVRHRGKVFVLLGGPADMRVEWIADATTDAGGPD